MPHSKSTLDKYTSFLLRDNYLQHLNFSSLFKVLPRVVLLDLHYYVTISWVFNHPSQSRSFLIVSIQPPRFQPILLQRFQLPAKQNQIRMIHPLLPLTLKELPNLIRNKSKPVIGDRVSCPTFHNLNIRDMSFSTLAAKVTTFLGHHV